MNEKQQRALDKVIEGGKALLALSDDELEALADDFSESANAGLDVALDMVVGSMLFAAVECRS